MKKFDVVILGAGASGLMCAIEAGKRNRSVLVLDSSNKVGKKILMSGGGRCNFTNYCVEAENFLSNNEHFCKSALSQFTQWDFIQLVEKHGVAFEERAHGQLFCCHSAKDILQLLLLECESQGVTIRTHCKVEQVAKHDQSEQSGFCIHSNQGAFQSESLVVACGGLSIPSLGSSGFGYSIAEQFGLKVFPRRAGLVPFMFGDPWQKVFTKLSGVSLDVSVSCQGQSFRESLLFTHRGLSGPVILQISNYWQEGMAITIDLLPDENTFELLTQYKHELPNSLLKTVLSKHLPKRLVMELEDILWPELKNIFLSQIANEKIKTLSKQLEQWILKPPNTEGYRTAEVTLGGVDTNELSSKTMECKDHRGLYFIGEVLDVTGHLGGFNFQWAWSSGYVAGRFA